MYVNDELKIRQYNQWDSYPTGQFAEICRFMSDPDNVKTLVKHLSATKFFTPEEVEAITNNEWWKSSGVNVGPYYASDYYFMTNRDWGAKILPLICMMPLRFYQDKMPNGETCHLKIADWKDVFEVDDLEEEEGDYFIEINQSSEGDIIFHIGGTWHGVAKSYTNDSMPTEEELKKWEELGYEN